MTLTNPTLAGGASKTFTSSTSSTLTLYNVQEELIHKTSNLFDFPMPTLDSNKKILMDLMGCTRTISIKGIVTKDDVSDIYKFADDIAGLGTNALIFGTQGSNGGQIGYVYTPEILNRGRGSNTTITVYVLDAEVKAIKADPNSFEYSIELMECDSTNSI